MQLSPNVHALRLPFVVPIGPAIGIERFVTCFVLLGTRTWIVDTGVDGQADEILAFVAKLGRRADSIERILLTHGHVDHMGSAKALVARTGAQVYGHPAERQWIENIDVQSRERPVPGFFQLLRESVKLDHELVDGAVFELAPDLHVRVLHVPGHSPGSCAFLIEEQGILLSGDAVPVVGDMPVYDEPRASLQSLAKLTALPKLRILAGAWDDSRAGVALRGALAMGSRIVLSLHRAVRDQAAPADEGDKMAYCRAILARRGLPATWANPMVLRTLLGHLAQRDQTFEP
jgi:glyoxylase-like metal-dependent hydrolase (beta-lactamase superfamily II)